MGVRMDGLTDIEERYKGYIVYIDENPDAYRGGFVFCVSDGTEILDEGLAADLELARSTAKRRIDEILANLHSGCAPSLKR